MMGKMMSDDSLFDKQIQKKQYDGSLQPLSSKNFPAIFKRVEEIKARLKGGDDIPPIYVLSIPSVEAIYVSSPTTPSSRTILNIAGQRAVIPLSGKEKEAIVITQGAIEKLGVEGAVATIQHEIGHDVSEHTTAINNARERNKSPFSILTGKIDINALRQNNEKQADEFSAKQSCSIRPMKEVITYLKKESAHTDVTSFNERLQNLSDFEAKGGLNIPQCLPSRPQGGKTR
jgi:hypothetical protein